MKISHLCSLFLTLWSITSMASRPFFNLDDLEVEVSDHDFPSYILETEKVSERVIFLNVQREKTEYMYDVGTRIICTETSITDCNKFRVIETVIIEGMTKFYVLSEEKGALTQDQVQNFLTNLSNIARTDQDWINGNNGVDYASGLGAGFYGPIIFAPYTLGISLAVIPVTSVLGGIYDLIAAPFKKYSLVNEKKERIAFSEDILAKEKEVTLLKHTHGQYIGFTNIVKKALEEAL